MTGNDVSVWWFVGAAVLAATAFIIRFGMLMPTARQRRNIAIGVGVAFLVGAAQAAVKHQGTPTLLLIFTDAMATFVVASIGLGGHIRESALKQNRGEAADPVPRPAARRFLLLLFLMMFALIGLEFWLLR